MTVRRKSTTSSTHWRKEGGSRSKTESDGTIRRPERGGSEWEPIKNLLEGD
jgi:hypothetical protein